MSNQFPRNSELDLRPKIAVIGVGGAGGNAVNNMIRLKLEGVKFLAANTDAQALAQSLVEEKNRIQLGLNVTQGLGAGAKPDVGRASAEETLEELIRHLQGSNMVFITAGMGGGTGTGAAPTIAKAAREIGILTVGVVTKPFHFEGRNRSKLAEAGIDELQQYVDTLIVIPNQNLFRIATEHTTFANAFQLADDVLYSGVRGVTDLMMMPGLINLDFADIRTVMAETGKAMMGTGEAEGARRALDAAEKAVSNPLLDGVSLKGARGVIISITGGYDMTLYEVDEAANRIRDEVDSEANIIFGSTFDERLNGVIRVSVVATGIGSIGDVAATVPMMAKMPAAVEENSEAPSFTGMRSPFTKPFVTQDAAEALSRSDKFLAVEERATFEVLNTEITTSEEPTAKEVPVDVITSTAPAQPQEAPPPIQSPDVQQERRRSISLFERFSGRTRAQVVAPEAPTSQSVAEEASEIDFLEIPAFLRKGASTITNT